MSTQVKRTLKDIGHGVALGARVGGFQNVLISWDFHIHPWRLHKMVRKTPIGGNAFRGIAHELTGRLQ